jgi:hypothetical protein
MKHLEELLLYDCHELDHLPRELASIHLKTLGLIGAIGLSVPPYSEVMKGQEAVLAYLKNLPPNYQDSSCNIQ